MKQDTYVPSDIIINVVSRLPVRDIIRCKCVCKSWLDLFESREFANFHLSKSKSGPGLAIVVYTAKNLSFLIKMIEYKDGQDLHYPTITNLHFPPAPSILDASADGLFLLRSKPTALNLCNPITRQYINLPCSFTSFEVTHGFGASKITGKYKVVRIIHGPILSLLGNPESNSCKVYTIGTGSWRSIACDVLNYTYGLNATLVNGNLHWFASDFKGSPLISCFDLETEIFTTFSAPPLVSSDEPYWKHIIALEDCLCLCDNTSTGEIVIWLMCEYGVEKSWTKKYSFGRFHSRPGFYLPIKILKDGDMFIAHGSGAPFCLYYSSKNRTSHGIHIPGDQIRAVSSLLYIPSFLSLKSFAMENVISY